MGTEKRERQKAARQARLEEEATREARSRRVRTGIRAAVVVLLALGVAFLYSTVFGGDGGDDEDASQEAQDDAVEEAVQPDCPPEGGADESAQAFTGPPSMCIDPAVPHVAEVVTNRGSFEISLDSEQAPRAVNNFVFLARWHYYDGVPFHRIIPDFMIQGGDPAGDGTGGPGYALGDDPEFDGELPAEEPFYPEMSVALANAGGPADAGSQFFVVTGPQGEELEANYTRFGEVTAGEEVVREIEQTGSESGAPDAETVIEQVTITTA